MGNLFESSSSSGSRAPVNLYLTAEEQLHLKSSIYHCLLDATNSLPFVDRSKVESIFGTRDCRTFTKLIADYVIREVTSYEKLEEVIVRCTRSSFKATLSVLWEMITYNPDVLGVDRFPILLMMLIELSTHLNSNINLDNAHPLDATCTSREQRVLETTNKLVDFCGYIYRRDIHAATQDISSIEFSQVSFICSSFFPHAIRVFESHMNRICFPNLLTSPSYRFFQPPNLSVASEIVSLYDLVPLAFYHEHLQGEWKRLYSSSVDGSSFNRVTHHILGYDGPTCIIIKCLDSKSTIIGAFTADRWKESNRFYGSSNSFLFSLSPKYRVYRSKSPSGDSYQWLNMKSYSQPHGLGLGGTVDGFRLFIPDTLEGCIAMEFCPTYEAGRLIDGGKFEIHTMEIWGCGGSEVVSSALEAQAEERQTQDMLIHRARQVDKAAFFNNDFDREFLLSNTVPHLKDGIDRLGNN